MSGTSHLVSITLQEEANTGFVITKQQTVLFLDGSVKRAVSAVDTGVPTSRFGRSCFVLELVVGSDPYSDIDFRHSCQPLHVS